MRKIVMLGVLILIWSLCGCQADSTAKAIIPAKLTAEEERLANLLDADTNQKLFDFAVDDTAQTVQINVYRLVNGSWALESGGGGWRLPDSKGRIVLGFDRIPEELRIGIQCGEDQSIVTYGTRDLELETVACATSFLPEEGASIVYDREIPLVIQILTNRNEVSSYGVDYFFHPEEYAKFDHEAVYAITVRFLQEKLS